MGMTVNRSAVEALLESEIVLTLATSGGEGVGACDLLFIHNEDLTLFWKSATQSRHSLNIAEGSRVAGTVTSRLKNGCGVQVVGFAKPTDMQIESLEQKLSEKRQRFYGAKVARREEEKEDGRVWYELKPKCYYYMDEETLGYERVEIRIHR